MPGEQNTPRVFTNKTSECAGVPGWPGAVTTQLEKVDYAIFQTDGISDCLGIGFLIKDSSGKAKELGIFRSISEHSYDESKLKPLIEHYSNKSYEDRQNLLKFGGDLANNRFDPENRHYYACALTQLLAELSNNDIVEIVLHTGSLSAVKKGKNAKIELEQALNAYLEIRNLSKKSINIAFTLVDTQLPNDQHSSFFALDSNGKSYKTSEDYKKSLNSYQNQIVKSELYNQILQLINKIETKDLNKSKRDYMPVKDKKYITLDDGKSKEVPEKVKRAHDILTSTISTAFEAGNIDLQINYYQEKLSEAVKILKENNKQVVSSVSPELLNLEDCKSKSSNPYSKSEQVISI
ncbi:hypothetical protein L3V79_03500 [Thiotrichales bacterium 19S9-12]|nr:hypothetical protein [Thiotrichales bacterium 19S9-11]MCF6811425.1 hypothetical protein [Thiotrichales bacterium 19S9-12]